MNRLLSRREKDGGAHRRQKSRDKSATTDKDKDKKIRPRSGDGMLSQLFRTKEVDPQKEAEQQQKNRVRLQDEASRALAEEKQIQTIRTRLNENGFSAVEDGQITYALNSQNADGDLDKAYDMLVLFQESNEGVIKPYNPEVTMLGAENRENVTCYLDSVLFAMFCRLSSFEPILCTTFDDEPRRRLSTLIRLWVNMLRQGKLIKTDVTSYLQESLAACGWEDAARLLQQDVSEAFCFITETLQLPLLTLKVDLYHDGGADSDDHKFVEERLLNVAVPDELPTGRPIRLEDCLENYFNNRVEVIRHLERRDTMTSGQSQSDDKEGSSYHIEIAHAESPTAFSAPNTPISPGGSRGRALSIIRRVGEDESREGNMRGSETGTAHSGRKSSMTHRREILMPAWQFFNLIPWYTKSSQSHLNNVALTTHLSETRPVLCICLKRYGMGTDGKPFRKNTKIDIPLDMRLPHFVEDSFIPEEGPEMSSFRLSLQSIICHRGNSVQSGHYITLVRGSTPIPDGDSESSRRQSNSSLPPDYSEERWIKFDDLAESRVSHVDIEQALQEEMPYLLFYQVQSGNVLSFHGQDHQPPSYAFSAIHSASTGEMQILSPRSPDFFDGVREVSTPAIRLSFEDQRSPSPQRHSMNSPYERRGSLAFTEHSSTSVVSNVIQVTSAPVTPVEETAAQRMSRAASRFTKSRDKSRPTSQSGDKGIGIANAWSRLNIMRSKDNLNKIDTPPKEPTEPLPIRKKEEPSESRVSISIEEPEFRPSEHHVLKGQEQRLDRSKSRKERKRSKSRGPSEKSDSDQHGPSQSHKERGREKGKENQRAKTSEKDDNDRDCVIM